MRWVPERIWLPKIKASYRLCFTYVAARKMLNMPYFVVSEILHGMDATEAYNITRFSPKDRAHGNSPVSRGDFNLMQIAVRSSCMRFDCMLLGLWGVGKSVRSGLVKRCWRALDSQSQEAGQRSSCEPENPLLRALPLIPSR